MGSQAEEAHAGLAEGEVAKEISSGRVLAVWEATDKLPVRYIVKLVTEKEVFLLSCPALAS